MMDVSQQNKKRQKISKNRKKGWKKTDIQDVEDFLEDERLQERTGGLVAEKKDEQLFVLDKAPDIEETKIQRKRKKDTKNLKCHSNLYLDPRIKPARIAHNVRKQTLEKRHQRVVEKIKSGRKTKTEKQAEIQSKQERKNKIQTRKNEHRLFSKTYDLWGTEEEQPTDEYIPQKKKLKPSKHYMVKPTEVPNVEVPHPGASYNPALDDYQDLLEKAHHVEVKKTRIERKIYNSLDAKFKQLDAVTLQETRLNEMSAGLDDSEMVEDHSNEDLDKISVNPPVQREKKKTKTQRNKEKKLKQLEKQQQIEKEKKMRDNSFFRLKSYKAQIKQQEEEAKKKEELKQKREEENRKKTRKLGKMKFEEPNLEIKLTEELEGSLRLLKPEGHLFEERFKSLQKRSIIEPRAETRNKRKYKPKVFVKRSHRPEELKEIVKR